MHGPVFLPKELSVYESASDDHILCQALMKRIPHLILYFEYACHDRAWALQHPVFFRSVLRWAAEQYYLDNLLEADAQSIVKIIQAYHELLHPFLFFRAALFFTVKLALDDQIVLANSLMFGVSCPALGKIFREECFAKLKDEWALPGVATETFRIMESYVYQGRIAEFEEIDYGEKKRLKQLAQAWQMAPLVQELT